MNNSDRIPSYRFSIRMQIILLIFGAVFSTVLIVLSYTGHEIYESTQNTRRQQAQATGKLVAENLVVAVSFGQQDAARELLESFKVQPTVVGALVLDAQGSPFATYGRVDKDELIDVHNSFASADGAFQVQKNGILITGIPLTEFDEPVGTLITLTDTSDVRQVFSDFVSNLILVLTAVSAIVMIITVRVLNSIVGPVIELTDVARRVSESENYSLRADESAGSEIGMLCRQFNYMLQQIETANTQLTQAQHELSRVNEHLERRVVERTAQLEEANRQMVREIEQKQQAYAELKEVQTQLVESSRAAGMAEIANGVLHNIGNVLNSVKVAASVATQKVRGQKIETLKRTAALLKEKQQTLGDDWVHFEGMKHIPAFLDELHRTLNDSQTATVEELQKLEEHIRFIEEIVRSQQSYARSPGLKEKLEASALFETALKLVSASVHWKSIEVVRDYAASRLITVDKNRVMQILSNFIKNAIEAMGDTPENQRVLTLSIQEPEPGCMHFSVTDTGQGIDADCAANLFSYGFTTKPDGHGFGLHSAACTAREMGGDVVVSSDGPGTGATFTLELPVNVSARDAVTQPEPVTT